MMNLLLNVLKAIGIALGWYLLLFAGLWVMLTLRFGRHWLVDFGLKDMPASQASFTESLLGIGFYVMPFFLSLVALYLPPQGRIYVAVAALLLMLAIWVWFGIQIFNGPFA